MKLLWRFILYSFGITVFIFLVGNLKSNTEQLTGEVLELDGLEITVATAGYERSV